MLRRLVPVLLIAAGLAVFIYFEYRSYVKEIGNGENPVEVKRNIYLITATGLRPDHLSSFLYQSIQTPALDFLAYDGIRFTNSWSVSPESLPAHLSLLSGIYPFKDPLAPLIEHYYTRTAAPGGSTGFTMPEWFRSKGYATAAFLADPDLRVPELMTGLFGTVAMGDRNLYSWEPSYTPEIVTRLAEDWIEKNRARPHFVLLNLDEPARPYQPPAPFDRHYQSYPYDGEIAALDEQIGLLINRLKSWGLFDRSILVFTSPYANSPDAENPDARWKNETMQVPLFIIAPGLLPKHNTYASAVSLVDIFPTVLKLLNMQTAALKMDGMPLFEKGSNREVSRDAIFGATFFQMIAGIPPSYVVRSPGWKLVTGTPDLIFSNSSDNTPSDTDVSRKTAEQMRQWLAQLKPDFPAIRSLGSPEAMVAAAAAQDLARSGKAEEAWQTLHDFHELPATAWMLGFQSELSRATGRIEESFALADRAYRLTASSEFLESAEKARIAAMQFQPAAELQDKRQHKILHLSYYDYNEYGVALSGLGEFAAAEEQFGKALDANPRFIDALLGRARARLRMRNIQGAASDLQRAAEADPRDPEVCRQLVQLRLQGDAPEDAAPLLRKLLEIDPSDQIARITLAQLLETAGNHAEAESFARQILVSTHDPILKDAATKIITQ